MENPLSFENVCKKIGQINKAVYGIDTYKPCQDCGKVNCVCDAEREHFEEKESDFTNLN